MVYGRYNELVFMGIIMVYNQQTSLGGPILYKQLEKIERYSGSIAGWFFLGRPSTWPAAEICTWTAHVQTGLRCHKDQQKDGGTMWGPPVMWTMVFKPHEYYSYRYHKP